MDCLKARSVPTKLHDFLNIASSDEIVPEHLWHSDLLRKNLTYSALRTIEGYRCCVYITKSCQKQSKTLLPFNNIGGFRRGKIKTEHMFLVEWIVEKFWELNFYVHQMLLKFEVLEELIRLIGMGEDIKPANKVHNLCMYMI